MSSQASLGFNDSQNSSSGRTQGSSSSESYIPDYEPQLGFLQQFGDMAGNLANQQYDWAQGQFADNQDLTDQNINGYLANSDLAGRAAHRDYQNYNDIFNPAAASLTDDWQSYTSPERVASEMGRSEGAVAQNFEAQRKNTERDLQSYGINPSDPRYAGAVAASRTAQGASAAAAGNKARLDTEATGRNLRTQALGEAHLLPGQQATEQNVAMQGRTGSQNAAMSNTSLGALTLGTTRDFLNAGIANNKFQPLGTRSSSSNSGSNSSQGTAHGQNSSSGSSIGGGGSGGGSKGGGGSGGGGSRGGSGSGGPTRTDRSSTGPSTGGSYQGQGGSSDARTIPVGAKNAEGGTEEDPNDPYYYNDVGMPFLKDPDFHMNDNDAAPNYSDTPDNGDAGDLIGDGGGPWGGNDEYAEGGAIPDDDEGGGYVPASMSPSGGEQTDDIPATVQQTGGKAAINAGEFVMPKDVVEYQGHKFFQDLIVKARKAMMSNPGPAHPSMQGDVQHHAFGGDPGAMMSNMAGPTGFDDKVETSGGAAPTGFGIGTGTGPGGGMGRASDVTPTQQPAGNWWQRSGNTMSRRPPMQTMRGGQSQRPMQRWQRPSMMSRPSNGAGFTPRRPTPATPAAPAQNNANDHAAFLRAMGMNLGGVQGGQNNANQQPSPGLTMPATSPAPQDSGSPVGAGVSSRFSGARSGSIMFRRGGAIPEAA